MDNLLDTNWQLHLKYVKWASESVAYRIYPELAERARREADEFCQSPPPKDISELALMIAKSTLMQGSWSNEFVQRAVVQANTEMMTNAQKMMDSLLHHNVTAA